MTQSELCISMPSFPSLCCLPSWMAPFYLLLVILLCLITPDDLQAIFCYFHTSPFSLLLPLSRSLRSCAIMVSSLSVTISSEFPWDLGNFPKGHFNHKTLMFKILCLLEKLDNSSVWITHQVVPASPALPLFLSLVPKLQYPPSCNKFLYIFNLF